ncbi:MAG: SUMF1/EgtB/PvdO family nonheme iron enzyme [Halioglobus sp.]
MEVSAPGFLSELFRRKVVKVTLTYIAVAWMLIQAADIALESFSAPAYFMQAFMVFAVLGVPVVILLAWVLEVTPTGVRSEKSGRALGASSLRNAIAVLPFTNMSSDDELEHFADGLSDHIISGCQQRLDIDVTSRNSTFVYKGQRVTIKNVATELDVAYVLEGSIQKQAQKIRVTAQLILAEDDSHLWAHHFDREMDDAFQLQDELTRLIVDGIDQNLDTPVAEAPTSSKKSMLLTLLNLPVLIQFSLIGLSLLLALLGISLWLPENSLAAALPKELPFEWATTAILILTIGALSGVYYWQRRKRISAKIRESLLLIEEHVHSNHLIEAFDLAMEIKSRLSDADYPASWWDRFSIVIEFNCEPADAAVSYRPYNGRNMPWRELGSAPLKGIRLPVGDLQAKLEREGYGTQEFATSNPGHFFDNAPFELPSIPLLEQAKTPVITKAQVAGMIFASARPHLLSLTGLPPTGPSQIGEFYLDKYPVTNRDYQTFVDSGAYAEGKYWQELPWPEAKNWQDVVQTFVDKTEQPGPADWELGRAPVAQLDLPVTGVSWFEAAAYANYAGKRLACTYEWARVALPFDAPMTSIPVAMMKFSNFMGKGKSAANEFPSLNGCSAYDMFGNVREWVWNEVGTGRCNLGGCDTDLPYFAVMVNSEDPLLRDDKHGFRCALGDIDDPALLAPIPRIERSYDGEEPVGDEVYEALVQALLPRYESVDATLEQESERDGLSWQQYSMNSGHGERIPITVVLPPGVSEPAPSLVMFPGMGAFLGSVGEDEIQQMVQSIEFVVRQLGYAVVAPYWQGAYERFDHGPFPFAKNSQAIWLERTSHWVQEGSQAVNFIAGHANLDVERVGFLGTSYGAINTTPILALEKRYKTALLLSGNLISHPIYPFADSINFYPRMTLPTLLINGRYDTIVSPDEALLKRRFDWLGTPAADKKQVLYDAGHWPFPQHLFKKEMAAWLQRYL